MTLQENQDKLSILKNSLKDIFVNGHSEKQTEKVINDLFSDFEIHYNSIVSKTKVYDLKESKYEEFSKKLHFKYKNYIEFTNQLFNKIDIAVRVVDKNYHIIIANNAYANLVNESLAVVLNSECKKYICSNNCGTEDCSLEKALKEFTFSENDIEQKINGEIKYFIHSFKPYYDNDNKVGGIIESFHDITSKKITQVELEKSKLDLKNILENSVEGIIVLQDGKLVFSNPKMTALTGYSLEELDNMNFLDLVHVDYKDMILQEHIKRLKGEKLEDIYPFKFVKKDKSIRWCEINAVKIDWHNKPAVLAFLIDITERKKSEDEVKKYFTELTEINKKLNFQKKELAEYNEEMEAFIDEISNNQKIIEKQNLQLAQANKDITDSINYASKIQAAILPSYNFINKLFENFILYIPKDIVSGDFFYVRKINDTIIFAVADCTGHGVPGGFLTVLCINFLNEITEKNQVNKTSEILENLREKIKAIFKETGKREGMDIAICAYNINNSILQFSGAYIPLYIVKNDIIIEYKAVRCPVGYYEIEKDFLTEEILIEKNDIIYLVTDGFADQFGGFAADFKKFQKNNFKNLLLHFSNLDLQSQKDNLLDYLRLWQGESKQTDDILVMGIKLR